MLDEDNHHTGNSKDDTFHDKSHNFNQFRAPQQVKSVRAVSLKSQLKRTKPNMKLYEREEINSVPMMSPSADSINDTEKREHASFMQMDCNHDLRRKVARTNQEKKKVARTNQEKKKVARTNQETFHSKKKRYQAVPNIAFSRFKKEKNSFSLTATLHRKQNKSLSLLDKIGKQSAKHNAANKDNREVASVSKEETNESSSSNALMAENKGLKKKETRESKDLGPKLKGKRFVNNYMNKQKRKTIFTAKKYRENVDEHRYKRTKELDIKRTDEVSNTKSVPYKKTVKNITENKELKNEISRRRASKHTCECHMKDEPIKRENGFHIENPNTQINEARTVVNILHENLEPTYNEQRKKTSVNDKYIKSKRNNSNGEKEIARKDMSLNDSDMISQSKSDVKVRDDRKSISENAQTMSDFQKQLSDEDNDYYKYLEESVDTD